MPEINLVISDPLTGKSTHMDLKDNKAKVFLGMKIGDELDGSIFDVKNKLKITGGSDNAGFPMRGDVMGSAKNYVLLTKGIGFKAGNHGEQKRKLVRGNTISEEIFQINVIMIKKGKETNAKTSKAT